MIKESVFQRTIFICDQCGKEKSVETELEKYEGTYEEICEFTPDGFCEIEELKVVLCDDCFKKLKAQFKNKQSVFMNIQNLKSRLTESDIITIFESLEAKIYENTDKYIKLTTICHNGESGALYYYKDSKMFHCYTDCTDSFDVIDLVCRNKKCNFSESINWINNLLKID